MKDYAVEPEVDRDLLLAGAQFTDAYRIDLADAALDARPAATPMLER